MKKYDWDKSLRRSLREISEEEREKVLDYYNEIYEDKRDRGEREPEIVASFGTPSAVAERILRENRENSRGTFSDTISYAPHFDKREETVDYWQRDERSRTRGYVSDADRETDRYDDRGAIYHYKSNGGRVSTFLLLLLLFWIPILALSITLFSICAALFASAVAIVAAGGFAVIYGFVEIAAGVGAAVGLVEVGAGVVVLGVGIFLFPLFLWFCKFIWKTFRVCCGSVSRWLKGGKKA